MFSKIKNIDTAFRQMRTVSLAIIIGSLLLNAFVIYRAFINEEKESVYVLANGKALEAFAQDRNDNLEVEARDHIKSFHRFFFSLAPDDKVIQGNLMKALYLADNSAKRQYDNLKEANFYNDIISSNISQDIEVDSVLIDLSSYPYYFKCKAKETITRSTTIVERNLETEGYLRSVPRSDNNSHGFLIERWKILRNNDISIKNRNL
jgi:conjugative transposon TraK protein